MSTNTLHSKKKRPTKSHNSISSQNVTDSTKGEFISQLVDELKTKKLNKTDLALLMGTSRAAVDRILDPTKPSNIKSLIAAANAVGKKLQIRIVA